MIKKLIKRVFNKRGESLIESLCAILIFTLASIIFLTMVSAAANINQAVKEQDEAFRIRQNIVEQGVSAKSPESGTFTIKVDSSLVSKVETQIVITDDSADGLVAAFPK